MGAEFDYDKDQNRDYSDLSDDNRSALNRARSAWGSADVISGNSSYDPTGLHNSENNQTTQQKVNDDNILSNESSWKNNVKSQQGGTHRSRNKKSSFLGKLKSAKTFIGTGIIGSTFLAWIIGTSISGLSFLHVKEIITEKLNSTSSILDMRFKPVLRVKVKGVKCVKGIICRLSSVSERNIKNLEKAGFKVNTGKDTIFGNKKTIESLEFTNSKTGETTVIGNNSRDIKNAIRKDPDLRKALRKGYSGRFASFLDKQWNKLRSWGKNLFKAKADNSGKTEDDIVDDINEIANNNIDDPVEEGHTKNPDDPEADFEKNDDLSSGNEGVEKTKEFGKEAGDETKGLSPKEKVSKATSKFKAFKDKLAGAVNPLTTVCGFYSAGSLVYTAVKDTTVQLLAQFALSFLSYADKMKAGHATAEEVAAIGNSLMATHTLSSKSTEESTSRLKNAINYFASLTETPRKAGTDSQGYRAIAYNDDIKKLDESAENYSVGATHPLAVFMASITTGVIGWVARNGCKLVGFAALALVGQSIYSVVTTCFATSALSVGIGCVGSAIFEGVKTLGFWGAVKTAAGLIAEYFSDDISKFIGHRLGSFFSKDFINAEVRGEDYGNAISSGANALMSKNARAGGAQVLTRNQAVAFYHKNQQLIAEHAEDIRNSTSPFDPTTRHTFLGSIVSSIIPYNTSMRSFANFIPSIISISMRSIANILPGASAADTAGFEANMDVCKDSTITNTGAATDIFCNVYTGIDTEYAEKESEEIIQELINTDQLDDDGSKDNIVDNVKSGSDLEKYIKHCYNRKVPIGVSDEDGDSGDICNSSKNPKASLFAVFLTDVRIHEGLEEGLNPK